jgi:hypothetical protein
MAAPMPELEPVTRATRSDTGFQGVQGLVRALDHHEVPAVGEGHPLAPAMAAVSGFALAAGVMRSPSPSTSTVGHFTDGARDGASL